MLRQRSDLRCALIAAPLSMTSSSGMPKIANCLTYQFTFIANWNWRGSYAAVACPAFVKSGLTAETLYLFAMLNMSTMNSVLIRSPNGMRFEKRISPKAVHGVTPALRARLPSSCNNVGVVPIGLVALGRKPRTHGSWKWPVGEYFEL